MQWNATPRSSPRSEWPVLAALVLVILAGAWLRSAEWFDPWAGLHRSWGGAVYANMARNLVRYDLADTRLGLIASTGVVAPSDFEFYYHHPPLNVWAMALSSGLFGVGEASARAVSLAASLAAMGLLYALAAQLYSRRAGLAAVALLAFMPAEVYYADHVDPYGSLGLGLVLLAVWGYARYLSEGRTRDLVVCIVGVTAGCLTTWTPYFALPLLLAHAALSLPREQWRERAGLLILPLCGLLAFALFVFHRQLLLGSVAGSADAELYGSLLEKLASRGVWASWFSAEGPNAVQGWHQHRLDLWHLMTPLPLALFAAWALAAARRALGGAISARDGIPCILLGYGLLHSLAFPGTLHGHDFLVRCYSTGLALCGGAVLAAFWDRLRKSGGIGLALGCAAAGFAFWLALALPRVAELRVREWDPAEVVERADTIRLGTHEDTQVLLGMETSRVLQYYIDRPVEFAVGSPDRLTELAAAGRDVVWIVPPGRALLMAPALRKIPHSALRVGGMVFFRIEPAH